MNNKRLCFFFFSALLLVTSNTAHALDPVAGTFTRKSFTVAGCEVASMTVKYRFHLLKGGPLVKGAYKWTAAPGTDPTCLADDTRVFIKVSATGRSGYITMSPVVSTAGKGYGLSMSDFPSWSKVICGSKTNVDKCLPSVSAKKMWRAGLSVDGFEVTGTAKPKAQKKLKEKQRIIHDEPPLNNKSSQKGSAVVTDGDIFNGNVKSESS